MELFKNRRAVTKTQTITIIAIMAAAVIAVGYYTSQITSPTDIDLGISLISQDSCGEDQTCYHVSVDCSDLAPREAEIRVHHNLIQTVRFFYNGWMGYRLVR